MRKIIFIISFIILGLSQSGLACDDSELTILNAVDNMDGTTTYTLQIVVEFGGSDGYYEGLALTFNSLEGNPVVTNFPASYGPGGTATLTSGSLAELLVGLTGNNIGTESSDSDFDPYENMNNVLTYENSSNYNALSNDITMTMDVTIMGCAEEITLNPHVNSISGTIPESSGGCYRVKGISNVTAGAQTVCNPADNTYTQEVTVTYEGITTPANLIVNGQTFAVTSSPQTVTLTGLNADGAAVDVSAEISTVLTCPAEVTGLFTAPVACGVVPCDISNITATPSACNPADNTYSVDIDVTYANDPGSGTIDVLGVTGSTETTTIGTSVQTITIPSLTSDGSTVNGSVQFSDDTGCSDVFSYVAPTACTVSCSIDNVVVGIPSACNPADNTYTCDVTVTYSNSPVSGFLVVNGQSFSFTSGSTSETVTLTGLVSDGAVVNGTVEFSTDTGCNDTVSFTAPSSCGVTCNPNNGTWD